MLKNPIFKNIHTTIFKNGYWNKMNKKCIYYSETKRQYTNLRSLLQNDTFNSVSQKNETSQFQKHITLIIIISIIIACLVVIISSYFLIVYIRKRCKKKKEEEKGKNEGSKNNSNSKNSKKDITAIEMSNINSSGKNFFKKSTSIRRNKTLSFNNTIRLSSIKLKSNNKININFNNDDKIINSNQVKNNEEIPKKNNEFSEFTFRSNSDTKDNDFQEILDKISI